MYLNKLDILNLSLLKNGKPDIGTGHEKPEKLKMPDIQFELTARRLIYLVHKCK